MPLETLKRLQDIRSRLAAVFFEFFCIAFLCFSCHSIFAERLPIKTYTVADGLLRDFVTKIKQDSRGFLWFCTAGGASRFDGYTFTNFTIADGLPDRHVNDFLETRSGDIWLATDTGLVKLNPKGVRAPLDTEDKTQNINNPFFSVLLPKNPKAAGILVLFEDKAGQVFAGTTDGLYKLSGQNELDEVTLIKPSSEHLEIEAILEDAAGSLWIGTFGDALLRLLPDGQVAQFTMDDGLPGNNVESLLEDRDGRIWVGMRSGVLAGLCLLNREQIKGEKIVERIFTMKDGLPGEWITSLYQTNDGQMWVGTIRGLCKWQGENNGDGVCKNYTQKNDVTDTEIWALSEDKDGNLWMGTRIAAKKLARYGFTTYTDTDGVDSAFLNSIFENASGELFVSGNPGGSRSVSRFNGEKFDLIKPRFPEEMHYFGSGVKQTVWQDSAGDWWIPNVLGVYRYPHPSRVEDLAKTTPQQILVGGKTSEVDRFFEDSKNDIWISTTGGALGLWRWERAADIWHDQTKEAGISANGRIPTVFAEDQSGHLWIGASDGSLIRYSYSDGQFKIFTEADGVPPGPINDLYIDPPGNLWIAKSTSGLLKLGNVNSEHLDFIRYSTAEGLSTQSASSVTGDEFGRVYIGTARGLDRLTTETGQIENFTTADGLPNSTVHWSYRDRKNNLWFVTPLGFARLIPEPPRVRQPPNIFITGVRISGVSQPVSILGETAIAALELDSDQRQVTVEFIGLGTNLGERLQYEYRFGGSDWTPTNERTVNFANLSAGKYAFEVRAQTADSIYSPPATMAFKIDAPIWQRWWFLLMAAVSIAAVTYLIYKNRLNRLMELEKVRTRIATDLHDDIGANLTRISLLSEVAKQKTTNGAGTLLTSIADIARESVASMNDIVWAISPDHDSLLDLTRRMRQHAEEVFVLRNIDLEFNAPASDQKLSVGVRRDVLLLFKEAVNNAAKHSACSSVSIDFKCTNSVLHLRIADNGKGFAHEDDHGDGQGLRSMKRRAAALAGNLKIESAAENGTIIEFEMPMQKVGRV